MQTTGAPSSPHCTQCSVVSPAMANSSRTGLIGIVHLVLLKDAPPGGCGFYERPAFLPSLLRRAPSLVRAVSDGARSQCPLDDVEIVLHTGGEEEGAVRILQVEVVALGNIPRTNIILRPDD